MEKGNLCWKCVHGVIKLKIIVPKDHSLKDFIQKSSQLQSDILAIVKNEASQYSIRYKSGESINFNLNFACRLKPRKTKPKSTCLLYRPNGDIEGKINHIIYSKPSTAEQVEIKLKDSHQHLDLARSSIFQSIQHLLF